MNPAEWLVVLLIAMATYRGSRLIVEDRITEPIIGKLQGWIETRWVGKNESRKMDPDTWQSYGAYLLNCYHCVSIYVGAAIVIATDCFVSVPMPVLTWATACAFTSIVASVLHALEGDD